MKKANWPPVMLVASRILEQGWTNTPFGLTEDEFRAMLTNKPTDDARRIILRELWTRWRDAMDLYATLERRRPWWKFWRPPLHESWRRQSSELVLERRVLREMAILVQLMNENLTSIGKDNGALEQGLKDFLVRATVGVT